MPRYRKEDYSIDTALKNIGRDFFKRYYEELRSYAQNSDRKDILARIHSEWNNRFGHSPNGTNIRIEWAVAIFQHGDWEKALGHFDIPKQVTSIGFNDPRKKYPAEFRCDNGVYVRSLSELFIADWLHANRITFDYEREVFFPSCQKYVHCDFYLPDFDTYVEFWGVEGDEQYAAYKHWKEPLYRKNGYRLISLDFQDLKTFRDVFTRKLKVFENVKPIV